MTHVSAQSTDPATGKTVQVVTQSTDHANASLAAHGAAARVDANPQKKYQTSMASQETKVEVSQVVKVEDPLLL